MVLFYAELAILVGINAKMHYFEPESKTIFWIEGTAPQALPYWGGGHPLPKPHLLGASPHICQPPVIFSQFSHWFKGIRKKCLDFH